MAGLIVVDASVLYEVITAGSLAREAAAALAEAEDHVAPEVVDVEVTGLIRRDAQRGAKNSVLSARCWTLRGVSGRSINSASGRRIVSRIDPSSDGCGSCGKTSARQMPSTWPWPRPSTYPS